METIKQWAERHDADREAFWAELAPPTLRTTGTETNHQP